VGGVDRGPFQVRYGQAQRFSRFPGDKERAGHQKWAASARKVKR
jgi:hypothetical protein